MVTTGLPLPGAAGEPALAPYGSWRSPITAQSLVQKSLRFGDLSLEGGILYWSESRPEERGRYAIVRRAADGTIDDLLPAPFNARTTVHEYGGGALLAAQGTIYFSNYEDQRIWKMSPGQAPQPLTQEGKLRFADYILDRRRQRLIAVCEDHSRPDQEPQNRIVAVDLETGEANTLVEGADFYSSPALSPDGRQLGWVSWNHPNMPWDDTELHSARFKVDGWLEEARKIAGGREESVMQPAWGPDGTLHFVSDRTDWWNLYAERDVGIVPILPMEAEFGGPHWVFGAMGYGFQRDGTIIARYTQGGQWRLTKINPHSGRDSRLDLPFTNFSNLVAGEGRAYAIAGSPGDPETLVEIDPGSGVVKTIRRSSPIVADPGYTSIPEPVEFPTEGNNTAHAFYYPPVNRDFRGPEGELPPLLVIIHGGPTSAAPAQFRPAIQYWTSRGFAVCDVSYGGSTGYGRAYRNRLRQSWGVVDVADAANAALFLARQGKVDQSKLLIRGGSAGGYTTLACLAFREEFRCGASFYGVSDLALLARDTHKFESRYLDRLVGPFPEQAELYRERSPIAHLERFRRPVILLQGLEDKVVPPNQAEMILASLKEKGVPVAYVPFEGEQHGFRRAENIVRAHEAELYFYSRILDFPLPEAIEPVEIFNLQGR
jgi:dipeptidyl aminopeptidase/acylaminoacyl peptidase